MTATIARWKIDDYHAMIESGLLVDRRVELLNGLIVEMPPEGPDNADLSTDLLEHLLRVAKGRYRVRSAKPIAIIDSNSEPEPDIALVKTQSYRQSHPTPDDVYLIVDNIQFSQDNYTVTGTVPNFSKVHSHTNLG